MTRRRRVVSNRTLEEEDESENEKNHTREGSAGERRLTNKRKYSFKEFLQTFVDREKQFENQIDENQEENASRRKKRKGYPNRSPAKTIDDIHMPNPSISTLLNSLSKDAPEENVEQNPTLPSSIIEAMAQE